MKNGILVSLALAAGLSLTTASVQAQGGETSQPCASSSPGEWCIIQAVAQCKDVESPEEAVTCAVETLNASLVIHAGVACGPCSIPLACTGSITALDGGIHTAGPWELEPGKWAARASYGGCYHVSCSLCNA